MSALSSVAAHIMGMPIEETALYALPVVTIALNTWWAQRRARRAARDEDDAKPPQTTPPPH